VLKLALLDGMEIIGVIGDVMLLNVTGIMVTVIVKCTVLQLTLMTYVPLDAIMVGKEITIVMNHVMLLLVIGTMVIVMLLRMLPTLMINVPLDV